MPGLRVASTFAASRLMLLASGCGGETTGELVEAELTFFARDDDGNVLGQYPEEYEGGTFVAAPAWIAGLEGAKPGIHMRANPRTGTPDYPRASGRRPTGPTARACTAPASGRVSPSAATTTCW
jgi:hypothetical protein